jgi:O-acetyl-ADP-ribose deacetylase (regulator of RNase III)
LENESQSLNSEPAQTFLGGRIVLTIGDITRQDVGVIVNAANSSLLGGGGVDGAIHRAGGPAILEECKELRRTQYPSGLPTGEAVITTGGNLPARYVVHTVGPVYGEHNGREALLLASCYKNSLLLAANHSLSSIAFPAISTGVYGYPRDEAAAVSSQAVMEFLADDEIIKEVRLIFFKRADADAYLANNQFT